MSLQCNAVRRAACQSSVHPGRYRVLFIPRSDVAYVFTPDSCTRRRRDEKVRKTFVFFVTNFQTVTVVYKEVCDDFDIFVMNGTLLHVTRQYVACFVFLF